MNKKSMAFITALFSSVMFLSGPALKAQSTENAPTTSAPNETPQSTEPGSSPTGSNTPSSVDASAEAMKQNLIVNFLHHTNVSEVVQSTEALKRLINQEARKYAETMVAEHQKAEQQVLQLAAKKGLQIFSFQPSTLEVAIDSQLKTVTSSNVDKAYLTVQLAQHEKALQDLNLLLKDLTDSELLDLANQAVTMIEKHIEMANSALSAVSTQSNPNSGSSPANLPQS